MAASFTEALRSKYCLDEENDAESFVGDYIRDIVSNRPRSSTEGAELGYLTSVVLSNYKIEGILVSPGTISTLCPNVVDLDLSQNFIENWGEVMNLTTCLPRLKCLNLTGNRFRPYKNEICWPEGRPASRLETMVLNNTGASWRDAVALGRILPCLKELHLDQNEYWKIPIPSEELNRSLASVELLTLTQNYFKRWEEINKLKDLPSLYTLILSSNPLQNITTDISPPSPRKISSPRKATSPRRIIRRSPQVQSSGMSPHAKRTRHGSISPPSVKRSLFVNPDDRELPINPDDRQLPTLRRSQSQPAATILSRSPENDVYSLSSDDNSTASPREDYSSIIEEVMDEILMFVISDVERPDFQKEEKSQQANKDPHEKKEESWEGFKKLQLLCVNSTRISDWSDLETLTKFPSLKSVRIQNSSILKKTTPDARRKLLVASLPNIKILNGSEINKIEREKSEIFYVKYFSREASRPNRYRQLVKHYGELKAENEVDLSLGFQEYALLSFIYGGRCIVKESIHLVQPVGKLKLFCSRLTRVPARNVKLYHFSKCFDSQSQEYQELFLDSLPMSRFDMTDGDEIHIDVDMNGGVEVKFPSL